MMAITNKYQFFWYFFNTRLKSIPPFRFELTFPTERYFTRVVTSNANETMVVSTASEKVGVIPIDLAFIGSA